MERYIGTCANCYGQCVFENIDCRFCVRCSHMRQCLCCRRCLPDGCYDGDQPRCRVCHVFSFWDDFYRATAKLSVVYPSSCVCLSVTLRYCIKTTKRRITQTTPHDSPMTLVFCCQRSWRNSNGITPYGGDKCRWGGLKLVTYNEKRAITRKRYKIDV